MSQMDISERRVPQDGRIQMRLSRNRAIDFRVNSLPTLFGEKIVLRILDPTSAQMGIDALGYEPDQKEMYLKLNQPQGMILVTDLPVRQDRITLYRPEYSQYAGAQYLHRRGSGGNQPGRCQPGPRERQGRVDFRRGPAVFPAPGSGHYHGGEIRDLETAEIAIKAAQTGHLVLSTLHTNSAAETITRLLNMGVPAFNVASSVDLIIAQRLARRLCKACSVPADDIPHDTLIEEGFTEELLDGATIKRAVGCDQCNSGYKGRVGIYEVVRITPAIAMLIMEEGNSLQIKELAKAEGFNDLREAALQKVAQGLISLEEANRITVD